MGTRSINLIWKSLDNRDSWLSFYRLSIFIRCPVFFNPCRSSGTAFLSLLVSSSSLSTGEDIESDCDLEFCPAANVGHLFLLNVFILCFLYLSIKMFNFPVLMQIVFNSKTRSGKFIYCVINGANHKVKKMRAEMI